MRNPQRYWKAAFLAPFFWLLGTVAALPQEAAEEAEPLPELGAYWEEENGEFINLRIEAHRYQLYFLVEEQRVQPPVFSQAALFYEGTVKKEKEGRVLLRLSKDGRFLTSPIPVAKPYKFWVRVVLVNPEDKKERKILPRKKLDQ